MHGQAVLQSRGGTNLGLLGLRCHDEELCGWMDDFDLFDDGRCIRGDKQSTEVVDQEFIAPFLPRLRGE